MCEHPFTDEPMFTTEPTVPSARILGLGSKMYHGNMSRMLNKDLSRFTQSFSNTPKSSERKKGGSTGRVTERVRARR